MAITGSYNIGQTGGDFVRTDTGFSSGGGGFGGQFQEGEVLRLLSGGTVSDIFYVIKNGQAYKYFAGAGQGNNFEQQLASQGIAPRRLEGNVINDFFSLSNSQGLNAFGGTIDPGSFIQTAKQASTGFNTPVDPNSAVTQRAAGTLPAQQFQDGRYLKEDPAQIQANTVATGYANQQPAAPGGSQGLQMDFYQPDPSSPLVVDAQGNPVSKDDYLRFTGQTGLPDNQINWSFVQKTTPPALGQPGAAQAGGGAASVGGQIADAASQGITNFPSTGNPQLDEILKRMGTYLEDLKAQGKKLNPNVEIEPATIQKFLDQATQEIEPYYSQQIGVIKDDVKRSLDTLQKQFTLQRQQDEQQFKRSIESTQESAADRGTIFSGRRARDEQDLSQSQQRASESAAISAAQQAGNILRGTEQQIGSRNLDFTAPTFTAPTVSASGFQTGRTLDVFNPSNITGSLERERTTAIQSRKNELEQLERSRRALNFYN